MIKSPLQAAVLLSALAAALYGRHLGDGYLSDDYLYLAWAEQGLGELLRRVTVDSAPQMLRPLAALPWLAGRFEHGAVLLHALGLGLHALAGFLVARIAWLRGRDGDRGRDGGWHGPLLFGALFVACPLLVEPVVWLSAGFDRFATCLALLALERTLAACPSPRTAVSSVPWRTVATTSGLFLAALLSKESVLLLPLIALLAVPRPAVGRLAAAWGAVAAASLIVRLAVFGGLGGYAAPGGGSLPLAIDVQLFARNVCLQLPFRVLAPLKDAWAWDGAPALAALSALLLLGLALGARRPAAALAAFAATLLALLPAASIFSIDVDHENSRLLYFPAALFAALGARAFDASRRWRAAAVALLALWGACNWSNGSAWREAGQEVRTTLAVLAEIEHRAPAGTIVLVAGHDTWRGAPVWRNGFASAIRRAGLRRDLDWRLGTAALLADPARLEGWPEVRAEGADLRGQPSGTDGLGQEAEPKDRLSGAGTEAFEISVEPDRRWLDWTPCQQALNASPAGSPPAATLVPASGTSRQLPWVDLELDLAAKTRLGAVAIVARQPLDRELNGRLWWRSSGERFRVTHSRAFLIAAGRSRSIVRLPASLGTGQRLGLRLQLSDPRQLPQLLELRGLARPAACRY